MLFVQREEERSIFFLTKKSLLTSMFIASFSSGCAYIIYIYKIQVEYLNIIANAISSKKVHRQPKLDGIMMKYFFEEVIIISLRRG